MFSKDKYLDLISSIERHNLDFSTDWHENNKEQKVLLRHDVDFSISKAKEMAFFEKKANIKSTYFFMLSSNMYNLLSKESMNLVHQIKEFGHKISLHFDPTAHEQLDSFIQEKNTFEAAFEVDIDIVSIHRPGIFLEQNNVDLFGCKHTYQDIYFKDMTYISDSGGKSPDEPIANYLENNKKNGLHLLIHPIWWFGIGNSPTECLNDWKNKHLKFITDEICHNCKPYTP